MTISRSHTRAQQTLGRALGLAAGLTLAANFGCSSSTEPQDGTGAAGASSSAGSSSSSGGSSKGGQPSSAGTASQGASGGSGSDTLLGSFKIEVTADEGGPTSGKTSVLGKVVSGATPASVVWEVTKTEGTCRLEKPRVPFCSPACGSAVCVEDDVCQPYPDALSVGAVTLSGVKDAGGGATLTLKEVAKAYQAPAGTAFAYPPFAEGDAVHLSAAGGDLPGFELETPGVATLWLGSDASALESGKPLELAWTAAADPKASSVHLKLDVSHHGGSKGMIECDQDDTGSLTIPASLITELLGLGVAGFPTVIVTRSTTAQADVGRGVVALVVASTTEHAVTVPGVDSCTEDEQCPDGETCQADLTCQ
ncbi:MAG TPA: hypothetical protein VEQ59_22825 [Polyangiaceae bacterium]|nr:hypothetical protein [Polyangiaceae bacterium]